MKKEFALFLVITTLFALVSCSSHQKNTLDGVYKFNLWYANDEEMCFEFKDGKLTAFNESTPGTKDTLEYTLNGNIITMISDESVDNTTGVSENAADAPSGGASDTSKEAAKKTYTLVHDGDYLYYTNVFFEADLGDKERFDGNFTVDDYDFFNFKKNGTCEVGVISPGGTFEVYGTGTYERKDNIITLSFGDTYPYHVAKKSHFYYDKTEGKVYINTFKKK